jgi:NADH dehydrogenase
VSLLSVQHPRAEFVAASLGACQQREAGEPTEPVAASGPAQSVASSGTDKAADAAPRE